MPFKLILNLAKIIFGWVRGDGEGWWYERTGERSGTGSDNYYRPTPPPGSIYPTWELRHRALTSPNT
jgi:hypothetical protein